jgi:hypothetical protein
LPVPTRLQTRGPQVRELDKEPTGSVAPTQGPSSREPGSAVRGATATSDPGDEAGSQEGRAQAEAVRDLAEARALADSPLPQRLEVMGRNTALHGGFPLVVVVLLLLFLLLQERIDRRDPKLALAPEHAESDMWFGTARGSDATQGPTETPR